MNLSGVQTLATPARPEDRIDFIASSGGSIRIGRLQSIIGAGQARFIAGSGSSFEFSDLAITPNVAVTVQDLNSSVSFSRSLFLAGGTLSLPASGRVTIGKHLYNQTSDEGAANLSQIVLKFEGPGLHLFEVGGMDVGPINPINNGNFGIGRIEVGLPGVAASLQLLDLFNNGNRGGNLPEALYLFGVGQGTPFESLALHGGSTLYLDNINVYARENGNWIWLNSLFGPGQTVVAYGGGYLHLPEPGVAAMLAVAGIVASRRRRVS